MTLAYATEHSLYALALTELERAALEQVLEAGRVQAHAEWHRADHAADRERAAHREAVIRTLCEKVRRLRP